MKLLSYIKSKIRYVIARIFGRYVYGIDYAKGTDKTVRTEGYMFRGKVYITKCKAQSKTRTGGKVR